MKLSLVPISALSAVAALSIASMSLLSAGCSDDPATTTDAGTIFKPPTDSGPTTNPDTGVPATDGGNTADTGTPCSNKPAGCFCGTPSTQAQFLNRCTTSTALPFTTTFKAGTATDLP